MNVYETEKLLGEYLLFHYGSADEILPAGGAGREWLGYAERCVTECVDLHALRSGSRALDLGCAVGRSTFELARHGASVVGIDYSHRFIDAAETLRQHGELAYARVDEGALTTPLIARRPAGVDPEALRFAQGDAMDLRHDLGSFDVVLMANLIDRLSDPRRCLRQLPALVRPGGQLVITSPCTWLEEFTAREAWLGGFERAGARFTTLDGLRETLEPAFSLLETKELPFLLREHARKFQFSIALASIWRRAV